MSAPSDPHTIKSPNYDTRTTNSDDEQLLLPARCLLETIYCMLIHKLPTRNMVYALEGIEAAQAVSMSGSYEKRITFDSEASLLKTER